MIAQGEYLVIHHLSSPAPPARVAAPRVPFRLDRTHLAVNSWVGGTAGLPSL